MNKVILIGNLTRDPEQASTPNGVSVCKFAIAVSRDFANAEGNKETDYFNIITWRGLADNCGKYLKKGNKVAVVGTLQNRQYEDKEGVVRHITEIVASDVEFLTPKQEEKEEIVTARVERKQLQLEQIDDKDLPF